MILGLTGYTSSGKDSVADILVRDYNYTKIAYADKVKELALRTNPTIRMDSGMEIELATLVADNDWDTAKQNEQVRGYVQRLGEGARNALGDTVWINALMLAVYQSGYTPETGNIVIPDVRYPNEIAPTQTIWRVIRDDTGPINSHPSEMYVEEIPFSLVIDNNGTLDDLKRQVDNAFLVGGNEIVQA